MKVADEIITLLKTTGDGLTASEFMKIVDTINTILKGDSGENIALGDDAENNYAAKTGYNLSGSAYAGGPGQAAFGVDAKSYSWRAVALGGKAIAGSVSTVAVGVGTVVESTHGVGLGRGAYQRHGFAATVIGSIANNRLQMGNAWAHRHRIPKSTINLGDNVVPSNEETSFEGINAYDDRDELWSAAINYDVHDQALVSDGGMTYTSLRKNNINHALTDTNWWKELANGSVKGDYNVDAGHVALSSGRGTGSGKGGEVRFKTAPAANLGQNTQSPLVEAGKFDSAIGEDTRFLLLDTTDGTMKRVEFGADDSAGVGFKTLKVAN